MSVPPIPANDLVERVADWLNAFKADPFSTGRDKAARLLEVVHHGEMVEALEALVEAVMDDDPSGAFAIAKHSGRAIIAKAKGAA